MGETQTAAETLTRVFRPVVTGAEQYGELYWCVGLADGAEVHAYADDVRVEPSGALLLVRRP